MQRLSRTVLIAAAAFGALCVEAAAQPAPIVYAGQGAGATPAPAARQYAALPGGDATSYGYGAGRNEGGGVLDLTRPSPLRVAARDPDLINPPPADAPEADGAEDDAPAAAPARLQPASAPASAPMQRPAWLEQERVGPPYEANGRTYVPTPEPGYSQTGVASWYGPGFHGQAGANGETFDQDGLTAAHPTLPINSLIQVTNLENGRELILRVTDRGPFVGERLIDVSRRAADVLGFQQGGTTRVHVRYLGPAPRRYTEGQGAAPASAPAVMPPAAAPQEQTAPSLPVQRPAMAANAAYVVQIGAYSSQATAEHVRDIVQGAGPVSVEPRQTASGGQVYRVRFGGFDTRMDAEAGRRQVADLGYPEAIVAAR